MSSELSLNAAIRSPVNEHQQISDCTMAQAKGPSKFDCSKPHEVTLSRLDQVVPKIWDRHQRFSSEDANRKQSHATDNIPASSKTTIPSLGDLNPELRKALTDP